MRTTIEDSFKENPPAGEIAGKIRKIANNTFRYATVDGRDVVRLHATDVVEFLPKGKIRLNSGRYRTMTTKARVESMLSQTGFTVYSDRGIWYVAARNSGHPDMKPETIPFYDGIVLPDAFRAPKAKKANRELKKQRELQNKIKRFVDSTMPNGRELPKPNNGDCWHCLMFDAQPPAGDSRGEFLPTRKVDRGDTAHLLEHIREGYLTGSLIVNAYRAAGIPDRGIAMYLDSRFMRGNNSNARRRVRRYLQQRLGLVYK